MNKIHKLRLTGEFTKADLPANATILSAGEDPNGDPCIWYMFNTDITTVRSRTFAVVFTGQDFQLGSNKFIGTFRTGHLMCHVFEVL